MAPKRLEALADAIGKQNRINDPDSDAYQLRSPGLQFAHSLKHLNQTDEIGRRRFSSFIGGYRFTIQDLQWKCSGQTRAKGLSGKLKPTSALAELLRSYRLSSIENQFEIIDFLNRALKTDEITPETPLSYFIEGGK